MYPVKISAFIINANHVHLILVVQNPDDVSNFIKYFKTETAHMLNRILGRRKRTVWCKGFDSPIVLTMTRALIALTYLYANPSKDNLEENIELYPGLSSWEMFRSNKLKKIWKRVRRPAFRMLGKDAHNLRGYTKESERVLSTTTEAYEFQLLPNAWMEAFGLTDLKQQESVNQRMIERIRTLESRAATVRHRLGKTVMGRDKLMKQPMNTTYQSKRSGKKMACLCDDIQLRIDFIQFLKEQYAKARAVLERWRTGDYSLPFPLGFYPPTMPKLAEPISIW